MCYMYSLRCVMCAGLTVDQQKRLTPVMLLMGAGMATDVEDCGKIRILGFYLQDTTFSYGPALSGDTPPFQKEVTKFMDGIDAIYPGSLFGVYTFKDRIYATMSSGHAGDFELITPLTQPSTAETQLSRITAGGGGANSDAYDVMWHIMVNDMASGLATVPPSGDAYDAKVLYVFTDGIPEYIESTYNDCTNFLPQIGYPCVPWCQDTSTQCCEVDDSTGVHTPLTSKVDYGPAWNSTAACPIDLATLGKKINDDDWYVAYISAGGSTAQVYNWSMQLPLLGIESRFTYKGVPYSYAGLANSLTDMTSEILCSAVPSNNPGGLPTGGATNPPTTKEPTVAPTTSGGGGGGGTTTAPATGPTAGGPTTGGSTAAPTTSGPTHSGQGGTTTTTTKKPFPIGLVCGCAAGALAAIAGGVVAANRFTGYPPMPEFEFEGEEGMGREESQRETQVAMGEADFA